MFDQKPLASIPDRDERIAALRVYWQQALAVTAGYPLETPVED